MTIIDPLVALRQLAGGHDDEEDLRQCREQLMDRILVLNEYAWERRLSRDQVERWLANFDGRSGQPSEVERAHALYILSQFMYFGVREIRVLLRAMYRDLFLIPAIRRVRAQLGGSREQARVQRGLEQEMRETRFVGLGNPSESGVHLLYYFRQENKLSKDQFLDAASMFSIDSNGQMLARDPSIRRYIFLDDVCGSGDTAITYCENFLNAMKDSDPGASFEYHAIFGTASGMGEVRKTRAFSSSAECIFELDSSFRSLSADSRNLKSCPSGIHKDTVVSVARFYGELLEPGNGGGFNDDQLLLGFSHNIPDNTLPILWRDITNGSPAPWSAAFKRYMKV